MNRLRKAAFATRVVRRRDRAKAARLRKIETQLFIESIERRTKDTLELGKALREVHGWKDTDPASDVDARGAELDHRPNFFEQALRKVGLA
jgi:hypothetical protein